MKPERLTPSTPPALPVRPRAMATRVRMRYLMLVDLACIEMAIIMAFVIRYEALVNIWPYLERNWTLFIVAPLVYLPVYFAFRLYYRLWRYASIKELVMITSASIVASALLFVVNFGLLPLLGIPNMTSRSVWLLTGILAWAFLGASRFLLRLVQERYHPKVLERTGAFQGSPSRVLIAGAGDAGAMILREMMGNPSLGYKVVGLVDDNPNKRRYSIYGVSVLGGRSDIPAIIEKHGVEEVIIAMPTAPGVEIRDIVRICEDAGIQPRTIPGIYELLDGTVGLGQLRNVEIEDLLRREPVKTDFAAVQALLKGKRVLVTGGGGSIGSELCRQILRCQPASIHLIGHGENSIFEIQNELLGEAARLAQQARTGERAGERTVAPTEVHAYIADVRFAERILRLFRQIRPEIVFHAAAHKHVPLMEANPAEAITNNVLGTRNILNAALACNVARFVMISTDKAVNPTSIMGASKRTAELLVHDAATRSQRPYVAVRFGNVLGSRGSVVLTFKRQIAAGGPVTVTHPDVKRYFMTIPEAVQLVLQSSVLGHGGEVFLLDMGEPVRIVDLAEDLIRLSGLEVGRDVAIMYTGMRPGEKLFEELFTTGEEYTRTEHQKIFIAANASTFVPESLDASIRALEQAAEDNDRDAIVRNLQHLIPEYTPEVLPRAEAPAPEAASGKATSTVNATAH